MKHKVWLMLFLFPALLSAQISFLKLSPYFRAHLSDTLRENSGLVMMNDQLFSINDSGNLPEIHQLNPVTGKVIRTFKTNATNIDWEAIGSKDGKFYIGDFGNNAGNREDLSIYEIPFSPEDSLQIYSKKIDFFYPEQTEFRSGNLNTNFDGEAMCLYEDKIHIFTKEWRSKKVSHYTVNPDITEKQAAEKIGEFPIGFMVTDAALHENQLFLIGYNKKAELFLAVFMQSDGRGFFENKPRKYFLGMATRFGQIEGIAATSEGLYISGEAFQHFIFNVQPSLYFVPYKELK